LVVLWDPVPDAEHYWATYPAVADDSAMDVDAFVDDPGSVFAVALAIANGMEPGSAAQLTYFGVLWRQYIWLALGTGGAKWDVLVGAIDAALEKAGGTTLHVGVDSRPAQPMVLRGRWMRSYRAMVRYFSRFPERSRLEASDVLRWRRGELPLRKLSKIAQDFAVITHFAEVGRGYGPAELDELEWRLEQISGSGDHDEASQLWQSLARDWVPAMLQKLDDAEYTPWTPEDFEAAERRYQEIRDDGLSVSDAKKIAKNAAVVFPPLGLPEQTPRLSSGNIDKILQYLFKEKHPLPDADGTVSVRHFNAHPGIAEGLDRLLGPAELVLPLDVWLLLHERFELQLWKHRS